MKLRRRRPVAPPTQPLTERETLVLLLGSDKADPRRGSLKDLMFEAHAVRNPELWRAHKAFLLSDAKRLGIARPADGYFGEKVLAERDEAASKWARRQSGHD